MRRFRWLFAILALLLGQTVVLGAVSAGPALACGTDQLTWQYPLDPPEQKMDGILYIQVANNRSAASFGAYAPYMFSGATVTYQDGRSQNLGGNYGGTSTGYDGPLIKIVARGTSCPSLTTYTAPPAPRNPTQACPSGQVPSAGYTDIPDNDPHKANIDCLSWWGITKGTTATTYSPLLDVPRDQMAGFLARTVGLGRALPTTSSNYFSDDNSDYFQSVINNLASKAIVDGPSGRFLPGSNVLRGVMAKWLVLAYDYVSGTRLASSNNYFKDDDTSAYEPYINALAQQGIVAGYSDGTYRPNNPVQRDEMASYIMRTVDLLVAGGYVPHHS